MATISVALRNAAVTAYINEIDSGASNASIELLNDADQVLAVVSMAKPSFGTPSNGSSSMLAAPIQATAVLAGDISKFNLKNGVGTVVINGTAGVSMSDLIISSASVEVDDIVKINALTLSQPSE